MLKIWEIINSKTGKFEESTSILVVKLNGIMASDDDN